MLVYFYILHRIIYNTSLLHGTKIHCSTEIRECVECVFSCNPHCQGDKTNTPRKINMLKGKSYSPNSKGRSNRKFTQFKKTIIFQTFFWGRDSKCEFSMIPMAPQKTHPSGIIEMLKISRCSLTKMIILSS